MTNPGAVTQAALEASGTRRCSSRAGWDEGPGGHTAGPHPGWRAGAWWPGRSPQDGFTGCRAASLLPAEAVARACCAHTLSPSWLHHSHTPVPRVPVAALRPIQVPKPHCCLALPAPLWSFPAGLGHCFPATPSSKWWSLNPVPLDKTLALPRLSSRRQGS